MLNTIEILRVLKIVRWCWIIQLKLDKLGRKSKGQMSMVFLFLFRSINPGFTLQCAKQLFLEWRMEKKSSWIVIIPVEICKWESLQVSILNLEMKMGFSSLFSNSEKIWRLVNGSCEISYAFAKAHDLELWPFVCNHFTTNLTGVNIWGLCTAIVTQLPFVSMELLSNKFEVQWFSSLSLVEIEKRLRAVPILCPKGSIF